MNILIVDDDVVDREHLIRTLNKANSDCHIVETESVDEGLAAFKAEKFDVVLLDYRMPKRDGIELLLELRSALVDQSVAIIMLSNSEESDLALECIKNGAQDFLLKSEVTSSRLQRAILQSQTRFELEKKLYKSYQEARELAEHDSLTGLANRYVFEEALRLNITQQPRDDAKLALILFDLDNFKFINDSHGHDIGDLLLKQVSNRVYKCLRENELFARVGGDEFAIILSHLKSVDNATRVTQRILNCFDEAFNILGIEIKMGASIGIAIFPDNSISATELLKYADIAMYRAKKLGRNQICYFEKKMQEQFLQQYQIEANLVGALERDEFILHYQPIVDTVTLQVIGFEALIRWNFQNTLHFPDSFIPIAESSRAIIDIGRWVIAQAIYQISTWNLRNDKALSIAINLSSVQLADRTLISFIKSIIEKYQVPPALIEFELTETALLDNSSQAIAVIESISQLGCHIALDDFGTGFSSVSHLQNFPINTVKIDKSLMLASNEPKTRALVDGLTAMLHSLGLNIVAEGIEDENNLRLCQQLNIQRIQGYFFSKPLSTACIEKKYL
ncbi:EAL domain-containing protein [Colwellia sp. MB02u-18]|uniref:putative bifunctional diguanylate cyclase/phosphodiesterase n=1 Tax=unclassified Colwellia TaxID=196834 RepID=UPI0015F773CF|nr:MULTISPECIES: GGDEF domain-containing response regulator [unclassified Colwellia]MBA6224920.1 EAL domain-containing protein [Colwellia sp. MB3u-45]MBA6268792.1 EAL domain-containing protein [Colwellia sp. MB3u-43]MBA6321223.1 EAL domain-containing protein [Colwellia sp. MB02u-19]MBA6325776.1 EAL domain-containing protein [Colwellia sp. MB02u-18]MBA6332251.1 EAL domain-containing protein [Colwellia sp. MB02u-12]